MSEERKEDKKRGAVGGRFEQGLKSALDKAPGLVAPSWLTMQSAMAGGAAGGAAAASWRWVLGPAAGAALIGGALWFAEPVQVPEPSGTPEGAFSAYFDGEAVEDEAGVDSENLETAGPTVHVDPTATEVPTEPVSASAGVTDEREATQGPRATEAARNSASPVNSGGRAEGRARVSVEPVDVPEDWADLPAERAASFGVDVDAACVGTVIGFRMSNPMNDVRVLWNFGDGQFSSDPSPNHTFTAPGTYDITLSVTRISDGLIRTRTIENLVTIHPNPVADFTWQVPSTAEARPIIEMRNRSRDAASATWVVDGEGTQAGESARFYLARVGEHDVQLVASSPHGCQSVARHSVEVGNRFGIGGSARFSPNGDGSYDTFLPRKLQTAERPFVFRIEDGNGKIVHETTDADPWDGGLPDGGMARPGQQYAWTVVMQGKQGPAYFSDIVQVE